MIHPPIDTERFTPCGNSIVGDDLVAARNVPYKGIDLAIAAAEKLGRLLIAAMDGASRLATASRNVTFYGKASDAKLTSLCAKLARCSSPQRADFGMIALDMSACGRSVVSYEKESASETIVDGRTGIVFREQAVDSLADAILRFEQLSFDTGAIRWHAERFSKARFTESLRKIVSTAGVRQSRLGPPERRLSVACS